VRQWAADHQWELTVPRLTSQHPSRPADAPTVPAACSGRRADIVELIMADHRRIRRLRAALDDVVRNNNGHSPDWMLPHTWQRLAGLLMAHFRAEEEICYLPMFGPSPQAAEWRRDATGDHDDIREAIGEASLQRPGSALWWRAVKAVLATSAEHIEREEGSMLTNAMLMLTMSRRLELGRQWSAFMAAWGDDTASAGRSGPAAGATPSLPLPGPH
jgi:Hemerythrin HHE cation binding domain